MSKRQLRLVGAWGIALLGELSVIILLLYQLANHLSQHPNSIAADTVPYVVAGALTLAAATQAACVKLCQLSKAERAVLQGLCREPLALLSHLLTGSSESENILLIYASQSLERVYRVMMCLIALLGVVLGLFFDDRVSLVSVIIYTAVSLKLFGRNHLLLS